MADYATLYYSSTGTVGFSGGRITVGGKRHTASFYPVDDDFPEWHDPKRKQLLIIISGVFHATTWVNWKTSFDTSTNSTYPYMIVYDSYNATTSSLTTSNYKVILHNDWQVTPIQGGNYYQYKFTYGVRRD
jgi:hypothetical protein